MIWQSNNFWRHNQVEASIKFKLRPRQLAGKLLLSLPGEVCMRTYQKIIMGLAFLATSIQAQTQAQQNTKALEEFEEQVSIHQRFFEALEKGDIYLPFKVQQYDTGAPEVKPNMNRASYVQAVTDPFYGYKVFILIDKSASQRSSKSRVGTVRSPQTMYIYLRDENNQLKLHSALPVSTGREPSPGISDTREGYMRVQSAQAQYTSKKYGEAMPYSLWFESEYGTAIHETLQSRCDQFIGLRASAGCIRLCPGTAESVFRLVTSPQYPRSTPIVLLDKRSGVPIAKGTGERLIGRAKDSQGAYLNAPKVIQGYPVFVRIIDGQNQEKISEIESIIKDPTSGFQRYFIPFSSEVLHQLTI